MSNKPTVFNYNEYLKARAEIDRLLKELDNMRIKDRIEAAPAVWIRDDDGIYCSDCNAFFYYDENLQPDELGFRYCPECGKRMEG